jgi:hypothetical protein
VRARSSSAYEADDGSQQITSARPSVASRSSQQERGQRGRGRRLQADRDQRVKPNRTVTLHSKQCQICQELSLQRRSGATLGSRLRHGRSRAGAAGPSSGAVPRRAPLSRRLLRQIPSRSGEGRPEACWAVSKSAIGIATEAGGEALQSPGAEEPAKAILPRSNRVIFFAFVITTLKEEAWLDIE